jgi:hypothetical protein
MIFNIVRNNEKEEDQYVAASLGRNPSPQCEWARASLNHSFSNDTTYCDAGFIVKK